MANVKISVIGAGSAVFSLNLIKDLCLTPNLHGSTVSFMDVDQKRLDTAFALCSRYAEEIGAKLALEKTTDRRKSLEKADFVVNLALTASHSRLRDGWAIAERHGYRFGGSYHIMHDEAFWVNFHQLKLFDSLIADILDVCPDAWYVKVANPVLAGITMLCRRHPTAKIVGLCHGYLGVHEVARVLGMDPEETTFLIPGVNHFVWLTHFHYKGEDAYPILDRWIEKDGPEYWKTCRFGSQMGPKAVDLYRKFGVFPIGDTGSPGGGTWPWWYHLTDAMEKEWKESPKGFYDRFIDGGLAQVADMSRIAADRSAKVTDTFKPHKSHETMVPILESIACDIPRVLQVNILNKGSYVPGIPQDFEVEIPALCSKRGVEGIQTDGLPVAVLAHTLRDRVACVEVELEAYQKRSKEMLLQLILMDPWSRSEKQAKAMLDEILALPYHAEMRAHFR
jgi:alpha-galactosidase